VALVYGIDFGTSTSAIMIGRPSGGVVKVRDPADRGNVCVPTAVFLGPDGTVTVGERARRMRHTRIEAYRDGFKGDIADRTPNRLGGQELTNVELVAEVLRHLRHLAAEKAVGPVKQVCLTVPVSWELWRRRLMLEAASAAGFSPDIVQLVLEPVAGAEYAFGTDDLSGPGRILVYDFGGGTFDCAVVEQRADGTREALGSRGLAVGGTDIDRDLLAHLAGVYPPIKEILASDGSDALRQRLDLRDRAERLKRELSTRGSLTELVGQTKPPTTVELTRDRMDEIAGRYVRETIDTCEGLLADLGLGWPAIDAIAPIGGSSMIPLAGRELARRSGRRVLKVDEPDLAVVRGATLTARRMITPKPVATSKPGPTGTAVTSTETTKPPVPPVPPEAFRAGTHKRPTISSPPVSKPKPTPPTPPVSKPSSGSASSGRAKEALIGFAIGAVIAVVGLTLLGGLVGVTAPGGLYFFAAVGMGAFFGVSFYRR
jgi:molecular chaperone DnaK (HSP70)